MTLLSGILSGGEPEWVFTGTLFDDLVGIERVVSVQFQYEPQSLRTGNTWTVIIDDRDLGWLRWEHLQLLQQGFEVVVLNSIYWQNEAIRLSPAARELLRVWMDRELEEGRAP